MHGFFCGLVKILVKLFSRTVVYGKENIKTENTVFVCNHQNMLDAIINFSVLPGNTHFMAKKELFENKLVGGVLRKIQVFPVDRKKVDLASIKHACGVLNDNNNLCIFPQGTRCASPYIEEGQLHTGVGMIALRQKSSVVPMMFLDKPGFFKKNVLVIGKALDLSDFEGKKINSSEMERFTQIMGEKMNLLLEEKR